MPILLKMRCLQLGLCLSLLEDGLQLGGLHDVALDLHATAHEHLLRICLAGDELAKVSVRQNKGNYERKIG